METSRGHLRLGQPARLELSLLDPQVAREQTDERGRVAARTPVATHDGVHEHGGVATGGGVPVRSGRGKVASSSVRPTPARVQQRLRRDLSLGRSAPQAPSSRTRCTSSLHSVRPHRRQATLLENDRASSRQVSALRIPTGSPTSRERSTQDRRWGVGTRRTASSLRRRGTYLTRPSLSLPESPDVVFARRAVGARAERSPRRGAICCVLHVCHARPSRSWS